MLALGGIGAAAILTVAGGVAKMKAVETDLGTRAKSGLVADALPWGEVSVVGRDATLTGEAPTIEARQLALKSVDRIWGVRRVRDTTTLLPEQTPYQLTFKREGAAVDISGHVPQRAMRDKILAETQAAFADGNLVSALPLARGAPPRLDEAASFALARLKDLEAGAVTITDRKIDIVGKPADDAAFARLNEALKTGLPIGYSIGENGLDAPMPPEPAKPAPSSAASGEEAKEAGAESDAASSAPLTPAPAPIVKRIEDPNALWRATRGEGGLTLSGLVPSAEARAEILALARSKFGSFAVEDKMEVGGGLPEDFMRAVRAALQAISRLGDGEVVIGTDKVSLIGSAFYGSAAERVRDLLLENLPAGYNADLKGLTVREPGAAVTADVCQRLFTDILTADRIQFEVAKAAIHSDSFGLLDRLVYATKRCPDVNVVVEGHTDSDGSDEDNLALSKERAAAVVTYLTVAGVRGGRLTAIGLGETKPIAPNDTDDGKALNRRIEFRIVQD